MFKKTGLFKMIIRALLIVSLSSIIVTSFAAYPQCNCPFMSDATVGILNYLKDSKLNKVNTTLLNVISILNSLDSDLTNANHYLSFISDTNNNIYHDVHLIYQELTKTQPASQDILKFYAAMPNANAKTNDKQKEIAEKINNLIQYGTYVTNDQLPKQLSNNVDESSGWRYVGGESSYDNNQQAPSANTLLNPDAYSYNTTKPYHVHNDTALQNFLVNASGAAYPIPKLQQTGSSNNAKKQYSAYQRTMSALQSIAVHNFTQAYADRYPTRPTDRSHPSRLSMIKAITTSNPTSVSFWTTFNNEKSLFGKMAVLLTSFFSKNFVLQDIDKQLEQIRIELATLITQNTVNIQNTYGLKYYHDTMSSKAGQAPYSSGS